jgi:Rap1a immunity proteins
VTIKVMVVALLISLLSFGQNPTFTHNRFTENGRTFSQDGSAMVVNCMTKLETSQTEPMLCSGYVSGVADLLSDGTICIPPEVATQQLVKDFLRYSEKHEDLLHGPASRLVAGALKEAYPCK